MKYKLNPFYEESFKDFLLNIRDYFKNNNNSIHKARNELKIISYNDVDVVVKSFKVPILYDVFSIPIFEIQKPKNLMITL
jgi:hypothetical protein